MILYQHPVRTAQSLLCSMQEQEAIFNVHKKREVSYILWDEGSRPSQKHNNIHCVANWGFHKARLWQIPFKSTKPSQAKEWSLIHSAGGHDRLYLWNTNLLVLRTLLCCTWQVLLVGTLMYTRICLLWPAQQVPCYTFSHLLITSVPQLVHSAAGVCLISHTSCTEVVVMALKMKSIVHDSPSSFHTIYSAVLFPLHIHFKWMCLEWNEKPPRGAYC